MGTIHPDDIRESFVEIRFPIVIKGTTRVPADNFLKVKETLTRIGATAYDRDTGEKILWQSCHILHKRGKYYIVHFKQLFLLDGKESQTNITQNDLARVNRVAKLLEQWGLVELVDPQQVNDPPPAPLNTLKILTFGEKASWKLAVKYEIGRIKGPIS